MNERPIIRSADDVEVKVTFTEGYQQRFTMACINVIKRRQDKARLEGRPYDILSVLEGPGIE